MRESGGVQEIALESNVMEMFNFLPDSGDLDDRYNRVFNNLQQEAHDIVQISFPLV